MAAKRRRPAGLEGDGERVCATPERREREAEAAKGARPDKRRRVAVADTRRKSTDLEVKLASRAAIEADGAKEDPQRKRADTPVRVKRARAASPPPPASRVVSPPVKLRRTSSASIGTGARSEDEHEEKPRVPVRVPSFDNDDIPKENREEDLLPACRNLADELRLEDERTRQQDSEEVKRQMLLRSLQVTPPPSARMLDKKNPPPPPPRPKRRRFVRPNANAIPTVGVTYARSYPRLALSPLVDSPPTSPTSPQRVFRSLADDFMAVQDTPQQTHRVRPAPRMARGSRRSTRSGGGRRSIDTPTSTMVLRSRQLNHNTQPSMSKPENAREREQREFHERERRNT